MTGTTDRKDPTSEKEGTKKTLTLNKKLELKKVIEKDQVRQSFSHGRSKTVEVEVKRKRLPLAAEKPADKTQTVPVSVEESGVSLSESQTSSKGKRLTHEELETRFKAVQEALKHEATEEALSSSENRDDDLLDKEWQATEESQEVEVSLSSHEEENKPEPVSVKPSVSDSSSVLKREEPQKKIPAFLY